MKQGRGMGEVVFIDSSGEDMSKAPDAVKEAIKGAGGSLPIVALSNAAGDKVYGTASHKALIGGLDKALKDAKRAMRADTTPGGLKPAAAPAEKSASGETKEPASGDIKVTDNKGTKEVTGAPLEDWVSNKGTTLNARLTKVAGPKVTLVTDADKTITVNQSDLSPESFKRLQEIIGQ